MILNICFFLIRNSFQMKYIQKKALDKPKEILQKKALEHAEYIVGSIKSRMPDAYKMDSAELDFWTAFEVGLSNDLKSYIEFVHAHQNELADIKYKELEEKFKVYETKTIFSD